MWTLQIRAYFKENTLNEYKGTYIRRLLIIHFTSWYSPKYSHKMQLILDNVFKAETKQLNEKVNKLEIQDISNNNIIFDKSIRTTINNKYSHIIKCFN